LDRIENDEEKSFPIKLISEKVDKAKYVNCTPSQIFGKFLDEIISFITKQSKIYYHQKQNTTDDSNLICNGKNKEIDENLEENVGSKKRKVEDSFDIWNNPLVKDIEKQMSEKDKEAYKIQGEHMYNSISFENPEQDRINDLVAYIAETLKSGMHPSYLSEEDRQLLETVYGKEWYKHFGYEKNELDTVIIL
jgi:hypothetical protein